MKTNPQSIYAPSKTRLSQTLTRRILRIHCTLQLATKREVDRRGKKQHGESREAKNPPPNPATAAPPNQEPWTQALLPKEQGPKLNPGQELTRQQLHREGRDGASKRRRRRREESGGAGKTTLQTRGRVCGRREHTRPLPRPAPTLLPGD
jgi:hypothetical protein